MSQSPSTPSRRDFIRQAGTAAAAATLLAAPARGHVLAVRNPPITDLPPPLERPPDRVFVDDGSGRVAAERHGDQFVVRTTAVRFTAAHGGLAVRVHCPTGPLSRIILRWSMCFPVETLYLGDAWERSYGDLQWRSLQPERVLPWYFAAHQVASRATFYAGVKTQPAALCFWMVDADGVSLWLDFRNGGNPSLPGHREIGAATIVSAKTNDGESPFAGLKRFCRMMCPAPRLAPHPICGNNNWYYAYGHNFDANAMRRDAAFLAELAEGQSVRPYCVIDAGWSPGGVCPGGPWTAGNPKTFPDLPGLAADMKKLGVVPGIWMRPTALSFVDDERRLRAGPVHVDERPLDVTRPENLEQIRADVARVHSWGYELIKHDFSTYDLFGRWGFEMGAAITDAGWTFHDRTLTNAEVVLRLYRTLRAGAGNALLLGCNTIGHLAAGLFEIQRTGDDTSGREWERTRRMGVNTLAFRLAQHGTFFTCDPDCAAHTSQTPWEQDQQFLRLVAESGTALFISADPQTLDAVQKAGFRTAVQTALAGGATKGVEPLDWLYNTTPRMWKVDSPSTIYDWSEPFGVSPFKV